jgi:hypothetical protein
MEVGDSVGSVPGLATSSKETPPWGVSSNGTENRRKSLNTRPMARYKSRIRQIQPTDPETTMDMNPVFFRVNDNTVINIAQIVRIEHQEKADNTESVRFWTSDQVAYVVEGERLKGFLRLVGKIH